MNTAVVGSQPIDHLAPVGGMDYTSAAHLLQPTQWRQVRNARIYGGALQQVARLYYGAVVPGVEQVQAVVNVPTATADYGYWIALTPTAVYQLRKSATVGDHVVLKSGMTNAGKPWSTHVHNNRLFFCNDTNQVRICDGARVLDVWDGMATTTQDVTVDSELYQPNVDGGNNYAEGPFTREPFFADAEGEPTKFPLGTFTWTTGLAYRVYVRKRKLFQPGGAVRIIRADQSLTGNIAGIGRDYIVVVATNTVALVDNTKDKAHWCVYVTNMPFVPSGRYCTVFFDHLVVAALPNARHTIKWSGLHSYMEWVPRSDNEADSRLCTDYQRADDIVTGITGLQHHREALLVFTPSCIYAMTYTGLPRVVRVQPIVQDYGNGLPYATAALDDAVAWCDLHHGSFYVWRGQGVENIGGPITDWFFSRLSTTTAYAERTTAFVDRANKEVSWYYVPTGQTDFTEAVVYNWSSNVWHYVTLDRGEQCLGRVFKRARTCAELSGTCNAQLGSCDALERAAAAMSIVRGTNYSQVLNEGSGLTGPLDQSAILLETGDLTYGSMTRVKEVHTISLHVTGTFTGINVYVAARNNLADTVTYTLVGVWTNSLATKHLTFKPQAGKFLRYKFELQSGSTGVVFHGYTDNVTNADAIR